MRFACSLLLLALLPGVVRAGDDELQRLQQENAQLRAQLKAVQSSCTATPAALPASSAAAATAAGSASTTQAGRPVVAAPLSAAASPAAPSTPAVAVPGSPALPVPPPGYMIVKAPAANSQTGCTQGMFSSGPDRPWKHEEPWDSLRAGMSVDEVSGLLGNDHYDIDNHGHRMWEYGKCGTNVEGYVMFDGNTASFWKAPDF